MENVNVFKDTIGPKENAFFAALMKYLTASYKSVFLTVEIMLISFQAQEHVNAKEDSTELKENVEFVETDKFMIHFFNVAQENK